MLRGHLFPVFETCRHCSLRMAGYVAIGLAGIVTTGVLAQAQNPATRRTLIVGLLSGETDYRRVELWTPGGVFSVLGSGDSRPFDTIESSPNRIVIRMKPQSQNDDGLQPDKIEYRFFANERSLLTSVILDEIDYARIDGAAAADEIFRHNRRYRVQPLPPPFYTISLIAYHFAHPILRSTQVRQALAYGINREEIYKRNFGLSGADILRGPFDEDSENYAPGLKEYEYEPKRAIALLQSDGWRDSNRDGILDRDGQVLRFRLFFQEGLLVEEQMVRQIKIDWSRLGIDVQPTAFAASALNDRLRAGDFDAVLQKHRFEETAESLEAFFGDGSGAALLKYFSPNFRRTLESCKRLKDHRARRASLQRLQLILNEDQPVAFLFSQWNTYYIFNHAKFENYFELATSQPKPLLEWKLRRPEP